MVETLTHQFDGTPLQTLVVDSRPAWSARHVGLRLGYSKGGSKLSQQILDPNRWGGEFVEGQDYVLLEGSDLAGVFEGPSSGSSARRRALVLFESGLNKALMLSRKPLGRRLRQFLADEVLPQLTRTGRYDPDEATVDHERDSRGELDDRMARLETGQVLLTEALAAVAASFDALTRAVTNGSTRQISGPTVTVDAPGAHITLSEPVIPEKFSVRGLKRLAEADGCTWKKLQRRMETVDLWADGDWHLIAERPVVRGSKVSRERLHCFTPGILPELRRREQEQQPELVN